MVALAARQRTPEHIRLLRYWCHQMETEALFADIRTLDRDLVMA